MRYIGMGDTVLLSPFIKKIKEIYPASKITFVTKSSIVNLYEQCPYIDKLIGYEHNKSLSSVLRFGSKLRKEKYDLAFFVRFGSSPWYANLLIFLSKATIRITYTEKVETRKSIAQKDYDYFYTHLIPGNNKEVKHEVWRALDMLNYLEKDSAKKDYIPKLELWATKEDESLIANFLSENRSKKETTVAIGVGASTKKRAWPREHWKELIEKVNTKYPDYKFVIVGDNNDNETGNYLSEQFKDKCINSCGRLTLRQTYCLLKNVKLYIGNNSGPLHIASAANTPCVEISCHPPSGDPENSCSPLRFGPIGVPSVTLRPKILRDSECSKGCTKDFSHCICLVSVEEVSLTVVDFLNNDFFSLKKLFNSQYE